MAGQIAELARDTLPGEFRGADPRSRASAARRDGRPGADVVPTLALTPRGALTRSSSGSRCWLDHTLVDVQPDSVELRAGDGATIAHRDTHGRLGGRRHGLAARSDARGRVRRGGGPRGSPDGGTRPHVARSSRGARRSATWSACATRHRRGPHAPGPRARCDPGGSLRAARAQPEDALAAADRRRAAVRLSRQGHARDDRPRACRRADSTGCSLSGFPAWVDLARRAPLLPDRLREPGARVAAVVLQLLHPRPRHAPHNGGRGDARRDDRRQLAARAAGRGRPPRARGRTPFRRGRRLRRDGSRTSSASCARSLLGPSFFCACSKSRWSALASLPLCRRAFVTTERRSL